jgi:hypothetical protein
MLGSKYQPRYNFWHDKCNLKPNKIHEKQDILPAKSPKMQGEFKQVTNIDIVVER